MHETNGHGRSPSAQSARVAGLAVVGLGVEQAAELELALGHALDADGARAHVALAARATLLTRHALLVRSCGRVGSCSEPIQRRGCRPSGRRESRRSDPQRLRSSRPCLLPRAASGNCDCRQGVRVHTSVVAACCLGPASYSSPPLIRCLALPRVQGLENGETTWRFTSEDRWRSPAMVRRERLYSARKTRVNAVIEFFFAAFHNGTVFAFNRGRDRQCHSRHSTRAAFLPIRRELGDRAKS